MTTKKLTTVDTAIQEADVPDITKSFNDAVMTLLLTPLGSPFDDNCRWGVPGIFWGLSGIAKSARFRQIAALCGLDTGVVFPAQHLPEDFSGTLMPGSDPGTAVSICTLNAVRRLMTKQRGLLFVDEASGGTPATQGAMLGMVNDRSVGDQDIPPGVRILLAANPARYSAGGFNLEAPMANRMLHFQMRSPSGEEWAKWLLGQDLPDLPDTGATEAVIRQHWNSNWSYVKGVMAGFMRARPDLIHQQPEAMQAQSGYCWASPRTWEYAARTNATVRCLGKQDTAVMPLMLQACVGVGPAGELLTWLKNADLPMPEEVLIKGGWKVNEKRLDITLAVINSCTSFVLGTSDKFEQEQLAIPLWKLLQQVCDKGLADIGVMCAEALVKGGYGWHNKQSAGVKDALRGALLNADLQELLKYVNKKGV